MGDDDGNRGTNEMHSTSLGSASPASLRYAPERGGFFMPPPGPAAPHPRPSSPAADGVFAGHAAPESGTGSAHRRFARSRDGRRSIAQTAGAQAAPSSPSSSPCGRNTTPSHPASLVRPWWTDRASPCPMVTPVGADGSPPPPRQRAEGRIAGLSPGGPVPPALRGGRDGGRTASGTLGTDAEEVPFRVGEDEPAVTRL